MAEVTAEQVQRGRGPDPAAVARRKLLTREVKTVRERLTSSTGLERAFDNELLRSFAQYRRMFLKPLKFLKLGSGSGRPA